MTIPGEVQAGPAPAGEPARGNPEPAPSSGRIRFAAIGEAWGFVKAEWVTWALVSVLYLVPIIAEHFVLKKLRTIFGMPEDTNPRLFSIKPNFSPGRVLNNVTSHLLSMPVSVLFAGGALRMALKQIRGGKIRFGDLFRGGDVAVPLAIADLLAFVIVYGCSVYFYFPGKLLMGVLCLMSPIIVDRRAGAVDALRMSWVALKGQMFSSLVFVWAVLLVALSGILACGIGIFFTFPVGYLASAIIYRDFFGLMPEEPIRIEMPHPPLFGETKTPVAPPGNGVILNREQR